VIPCPKSPKGRFHRFEPINRELIEVDRHHGPDIPMYGYDILHARKLTLRCRWCSGIRIVYSVWPHRSLEETA